MNELLKKKREHIQNMKDRLQQMKNLKQEEKNIQINEMINDNLKESKIEKNIFLNIENLDNIFYFKSKNLENNEEDKFANKYSQTNIKQKSINKNSVMSRLVRNTINTNTLRNYFQNTLNEIEQLQNNSIIEEEENLNYKKIKPYKYKSNEDFKNMTKNNNFNDFETFINKSSKYIEKLFFNKTRNKENIKNDYYNKKLNRLNNYYSNFISWSNLFENLYLSVYSFKDLNQKINNDIKSFCYIWNVNYNYPEFQLKSDKEINKCIFHKNKGDIIIGGVENGNIVLFDTRASIYPVLKSKNYIDNESSKLIGWDFLENNNIVSGNEDGRIFHWDLKNIKKPIKNNIYSYYYLKGKDKLFIYSLCMSINHNLNNIYLGCFDNSIKEISKKNDDENIIEKIFHGHFGPVTSICHSKYKNSNFLNSIMISSSMDWGINFWNEEISIPIYNLSIHKDYISSIDWNPFNPGIISSSDTSGNYYIWNLIENKNYPVKKFESKSKLGINNVKFNNNGNLLAISDLEGNVEIKRWNEENLSFTQNDIKNLEKFLDTNSENKRYILNNIENDSLSDNNEL